MNISDLKVGDKVYIRDDLQTYENYGGITYFIDMEYGVKIIEEDARGSGYISCSDGWAFSSEMIDWKKTEELNSLPKLPTIRDNYCDSCRNKVICKVKDDFNSIEEFEEMQDKKKIFSLTCDLYVEVK